MRIRMPMRTTTWRFYLCIEIEDDVLIPDSVFSHFCLSIYNRIRFRLVPNGFRMQTNEQNMIRMNQVKTVESEMKEAEKTARIRNEVKTNEEEIGKRRTNQEKTNTFSKRNSNYFPLFHLRLFSFSSLLCELSFWLFQFVHTKIYIFECDKIIVDSFALVMMSVGAV